MYFIKCSGQTKILGYDRLTGEHFKWVKLTKTFNSIKKTHCITVMCFSCRTPLLNSFIILTNKKYGVKIEEEKYQDEAPFCCFVMLVKGVCS